MGQVAACTGCCSSVEPGAEGIGIVVARAALQADLAPETRLVAWFRRRSGPECDFGEVFEELFGGRDSVGETKFASVLKERGAGSLIDATAAFNGIDRLNKGALGAMDFEAWQEEVEKKEVEGLRVWRDWLRKRYATPSAAYNAMGKGEGDVLVEAEFTQALTKLGFENDKPLELFRFIDKDFSGEVTFAEFKSAMRSVGVQRQKASSSKKGNSSKSSKANSPRQQQRREESDSEQVPNPSPDGSERDRKTSKEKGQPTGKSVNKAPLRNVGEDGKGNPKKPVSTSKDVPAKKPPAESPPESEGGN